MRNGKRWKLKLATAGVLAAIAATSFAGQLTLYPRPGFQGPGVTTTRTRRMSEACGLAMRRRRSSSATG
jgi:hypothetical protein